MRIRLQQIRLLDPWQQRDETIDLCLHDREVVACAAATPDGFQPDHNINASGLWLMPGLTDLYAQLDETTDAELKAAHAQGIRRVVCAPTSHWQADTSDRTGCERIHIAPLTQQLQGIRLSPMASYREHGARLAGQGRQPIRQLTVLRRAMQYAKAQGLTLFLSPLQADFEESGCLHEGRVSTRLGLPGIPAASEVIGLQTLITLIRATGARVHCGQISSRESLPLLRQAKDEGLPITADVSLLHLFCSDNDLLGFNSALNVRPVLRSPEDRDALRDALHEGLLDGICSQHTPWEDQHKVVPFPDASPGASTWDGFLSLLLRLQEELHESPLDCLRRLCVFPAQLLDAAPDAMAAGSPLASRWVLVDPHDEYTLSPNCLNSQGKSNPFLGWRLRGKTRALDDLIQAGIT